MSERKRERRRRERETERESYFSTIVTTSMWKVKK